MSDPQPQSQPLGCGELATALFLLRDQLKTLAPRLDEAIARDPMGRELLDEAHVSLYFAINKLSVAGNKIDACGSRRMRFEVEPENFQALGDEAAAVTT